MLVAAFLVLSQVRLAISIPMIEITIRNFDNQMEPATRPTTHICEATKTITGILPEDWRVNVTTTNDEEYDNPDFFSIGDLLQKIVISVLKSREFCNYLGNLLQKVSVPI